MCGREGDEGGAVQDGSRQADGETVPDSPEVNYTVVSTPAIRLPSSPAAGILAVRLRDLPPCLPRRGLCTGFRASWASLGYPALLLLLLWASLGFPE